MQETWAKKIPIIEQIKNVLDNSLIKVLPQYPMNFEIGNIFDFNN